MVTVEKNQGKQAIEGLANIAAISPYIPGKPISELARQLNLEANAIIKLASNENPWGMSPLAQQAVYAELNSVERYPDQHDLIAHLARHHQVNPQQIVLGNGSNDVLDLIARTFLNQQYRAVYSQYAFAIYAIATLSAGANAIVATADVQLGHDLEQLLAATAKEQVKLVWLANPNNPTGTFIAGEKLADFCAQVPTHIAIVIDEAYNEYLAENDRYDSVKWLDKFPNLIVTRTFSKIYGLAGLRIGYAVASEYVAGLLNRVRQPFNVNNLALVAALAAHGDSQFIEHSYRANLQQRDLLNSQLQSLGCKCLPSSGNFICFKIANCQEVNSKLLQAGIIVRPLAGYGMPDYLRVTIGKPEENQQFIKTLRHIINNVN